MLDMFIKSEGIRKSNTKQLDWHNLFDSRYGRRQWGSGWYMLIYPSIYRVQKFKT